MKRAPFFRVLLLLTVMLSFASGESRSGQVGSGPADYVNTFVGTAGRDMGNTFPGAALPFGMIQWSPETTTGLVKRGGSYVYREDGIRGFSLNHLSGTGCGIMGDVPIQPVVGALTSSPALDSPAYLAKFSHRNEEASPGFYSVAFDNGTKVQLTVTTRAGMGDFTFPASDNSSILFNVGRDANTVRSATIEIAGDRKISGSVSTEGYCNLHQNKYTVYFAAEFSRPFANFGTWNGPNMNKDQPSATGPGTGGWVGFDTTKNHVVEMKVALSYVSVANAWGNLTKEIPGWSFDAVRQWAHNRWDHDLGLITVNSGTDDEKRVFYTALYHALLQPNIFNDSNLQYIGFDNQVHLAKDFTVYANYSGWDIYRCQVQLLAMLFPKETSDMVQSLVVDAQQGGALPRRPIVNNDACTMVGAPSCPIIADAYAFGARRFDAKAALAEMLKVATQPGLRCNECGEWDSLDVYLKLGYLGPDTPGARGRPSGPSQTLEYTTADFSIAQIARALGDTTASQAFMKRAQYWRNTFNTKAGYIEPRNQDGVLIPVDPAAHQYFVEGNASQYSWMIPYNLRSVFDLMGGDAKVVQRLDTFFTELNAGEDRPYFWVGNEPVFAVPWAYDFAGTPWRAQAVVRRVESELFTPTPDGEPGNDDQGAMSAWYVFAALGVYPAIPAVGGLALNSPLFPSATIHLGNGKIIKIMGENATAANPYVQSLRVNGKPSENTWIPYDTLSQGVTLQFKLGSTPNKQWGTKPEEAPPSFSEGMDASGK